MNRFSTLSRLAGFICLSPAVIESVAEVKPLTPQQTAHSAHQKFIDDVLSRATEGGKANVHYSNGLRGVCNVVEQSLEGVKSKDRDDNTILATLREGDGIGEIFVQNVRDAAQKMIDIAEGLADMLTSEHQSQLSGGSRPDSIVATTILARVRESKSAAVERANADVRNNRTAK